MSNLEFHFMNFSLNLTESTAATKRFVLIFRHEPTEFQQTEYVF